MDFIKVLFLHPLIFSLIQVINGDVLPSIIWDPRNYLFQCNNLTIYMRSSDLLYFTCPTEYLISKKLEAKVKDDNLYEKIVLAVKGANLEKFTNCDTSDLIGRTVEKYCRFDNNDKKSFQVTGTPSSVFPNDDDSEGQIVLFSTSMRTEDHIDDKFNGSCSGPEGYYPLKITVIRCAKGDTNCEKNICNTPKCYERGCGIWSSWQSTDTFIWNGTTCLQEYNRNCVSKYFNCDGPTEEYRSAPSRDNCTFEKQECPTMTSLISPSPSTTSIPTPTGGINNISSSVSGSFINATSSIICPNCSCPSQSIVSVVQTPAISVVTTTVYQATTVVSMASPTTPYVSTINVTVTTTVTESQQDTKTETKTITKIKTETEKETVTKTCDVVVTPTAGYITTDIPYDSKFYITVISAIIGAILVGVFVTHACIAYKKGNKVKKSKVIRVQEYNNQSTTIIEQQSKVISNGRYTKLGSTSPIN